MFKKCRNTHTSLPSGDFSLLLLLQWASCKEIFPSEEQQQTRDMDED